METNSPLPSTTKPEFHELTPCNFQQQHMGASTGFGDSKQALARRRVLRSAKTRALKTYEGFSQAHADSLAPSNCFVRLRLSDQRLKHAGIPTIKTRWERRLVHKSAGPSSIATKNLHAIGQVNTFLTRNEEKVESAVNVKNNEEKDKFGEIDKDVISGDAHLANQDGVPSCPVSINQEPKCPTLGAPNFQLNSRERSIGQGSSHPLLQHWITKSTAQPDQQTSNTQTATGSSVNCGKSAQLTVSGPSQSVRSEAVKSILEIRYRADNCAAESPRASFIPAERKIDRNASNNGLNAATCGESDALIEQGCRSPNSDPGPIENTKSGKLLPQDCQTKSSPTPPDRDTLVESNRHLRGTSHSRYPEDPRYSWPTSDMAPVRDPNNVDSSLKDAIQKLYEVQSQVHGFVPETQPLLIEKMTELARSLDHLQTITSPMLSPNNPIHKNRIAPEVIDYVDDSRNPDIYNREFIELVQRGNAVMNGKQQAFRDFSEIFAKALKDGMPELSSEVDKVMKNANLGAGSSSKPGEEGANGAERPNGKGSVRREAEPGTNGT